jgi:hypothetical protein
MSIPVVLNSSVQQLRSCMQAVQTNLEILFGVKGARESQAMLKGDYQAPDMRSVRGSEIAANVMPPRTVVTATAGGVTETETAVNAIGITMEQATGPGQPVMVCYCGLVEGFTINLIPGEAQYVGPGGTVINYGSAENRIGVALTGNRMVFLPGARA